MLALAGATMTTSGSSSSSMIITTSGTNADTETRPIHKKTLLLMLTSTPAVAAGTIMMRTSALLHKLAYNLVAEHRESYATATASRQGKAIV
jgi:hypothetical protein